MIGCFVEDGRRERPESGSVHPEENPLGGSVSLAPKETNKNPPNQID